MSSASLIGTARTTSRRLHSNRTMDDNEEDDGDMIMNSAEFLQNLNQTNTVADVILNDTNPQKRNAIRVISKQSAIAKTILEAISNEEQSIRLNTVKTINVLQLMSNIYDNKFVIVNQ
ncbi:P12 [Chrysodeixis chalcites nucleopolyhedrovirus]|uniref:p12 n=1 Tax=Chrysodeixis chalcites nucleopolyhedrovirus TaxID=320432 RepID=Q4KSY5_9ABAC|nr:P12 [Chrysodeixis chalcites nucleopolyhedrovirus]AGC36309.1 P12 protein [Chrysodeixis chalcites SNPV TF1-A]AAY84026.1 P12 [Chrysodeixis chalcites nucleopolyhedrovirus]AGE61356.1 P12 protein [Chrysodeixis chalcites nucleopolyhedrovirus]AGE61501.1 P12 protein [Chrysodeixis chalcites nucleopolyhedrovirus]AGE61655.1 P12 protein [Chrysodeixis chalcites nucleopolyhedrovirus]